MENTAVLPYIRRAREYRLYDNNGRRYLDFYQDNGQAIAGHRPARAILEIKSLLSRGLIAAYPSVYTAQAVKALFALIPDAEDIRLYRSVEKATRAAELHAGSSVGVDDIVDPAVRDSGSGHLGYWRPFADMDGVDVPMLLPILPLAAPPAAAALVFREPPAAAVPASDICSPVCLAALKRSVYDLIAYIEECDRSRWDHFDRYSLWTRRGPYLSLNSAEADFAELFAELLNHGIVIAPRWSAPSIVPGEYSPGELSFLDEKFTRS